MADLWDYLRAVASQWVALMSGGAIIVGLGLLERFSGQTVPTYVYVGVLILFIFIACYKAWQGERRRRLESESKLSQVQTELVEERKKQTPDLEGEITFVSFGSHLGIANITLFASIRSLGMQTIVRNYTLSIDLPGKGNIVITPTHFEGTITLARENHSGMSFNSKDVLYAKTYTKPIETGSMVEGAIIFVLPGVSKDEAFNARHSLFLSYQDVRGRIYTIKCFKSSLDVEVPPQHFPGMPTKIVPPDTPPDESPKKPPQKPRRGKPKKPTRR